ncbi:MAG: hypothetical protein ACSW8G_03140 [Bacillota bacterium]
MRDLLQRQAISIEEVPAGGSCPVWKKLDETGKPYWGVSDFCHMDDDVSGSEDLTRLEWDGNDFHLDADSDGDVPDILREGISLMKAWEQQLIMEEQEMAFVILASYDDGSFCGSPSLNLRLWADRGGEEPADLSGFEEQEQPGLISVFGK